ncbi:hypothetical protein [Streptomyces fructofermentans]|uniref:hypothetical protein n=1 Tax=Streptomyces fructofermentans TaxID=152141 RepID=UPI003797F26F
MRDTRPPLAQARRLAAAHHRKRLDHRLPTGMETSCPGSWKHPAERSVPGDS